MKKGSSSRLESSPSVLVPPPSLRPWDHPTLEERTGTVMDGLLCQMLRDIIGPILQMREQRLKGKMTSPVVNTEPSRPGR